MKKKDIHSIINYFIAAVWLVNGFYCKVINQVPRHRQIVSVILGNQYAATLTILIGVGEILMAVWILSRYQRKLNVLVQIIVIASMNVMEFLLVPDLLLWGRVNIVFAFLFIGLIFYNGYMMSENKTVNRV